MCLSSFSVIGRFFSIFKEFCKNKAGLYQQTGTFSIAKLKHTDSPQKSAKKTLPSQIARQRL
jgi:hypothetical protein